MTKLISMTDFVSNYTETGCLLKEINKIRNYANFLKQPLKLEMFVPCVNGEPFNHSKHGNVEQYEKAKEKVLFEGFSFVKKLDDYCGNLFYRFEQNDEILNINFSHYSSIEKLIELDNIELTKNALKQFL